MRILSVLLVAFMITSCSENGTEDMLENGNLDPDGNVITTTYRDFLSIDLDNLDDYTSLNLPEHYQVVAASTNTPGNNLITDEGASLGRVLFYDTNLSINNSVSCASCHDQNIGFDDANRFSVGFEGELTDAHAMRLLNAQFYLGENFFWDRRAVTLEIQTTQPIQNEIEMGFDQAHGGFEALVTRLDDISYYPELFTFVYGDVEITEDRVQKAIAQFIRAMVSTESRFDDGFAEVFNVALPGQGVGQDFPNYTDEENLGKSLFTRTPVNGGVGCAACHLPPTFALNANSQSNGLDVGETTIFKAPSLKSVALSTQFMHDGRFETLEEVIEHYNSGVQAGPALDNRLTLPNGNMPLQLNLTQAEKDALASFLITLNDEMIASDTRFSDPFIN